MTHRVAVIGAGWAGLSCAHGLSTTAGVQVQVFEAAPQLGGRARSVYWIPQKGGESLTIDNGQHMLVGAYSATLSLLGALGSAPKRLDRFPVTLISSDGLELRGAKLPAPWHLLIAALRSKGLQPQDFASLRGLQKVLQRCDFHPNEKQTVSQLLAQAAVTERVRDRLMRPLCLATLNTPMEIASAAIFSAVLRDTLFARAQASDFLVANVSLSEVFANPMERQLLSRGVEIHKNTRVSHLTHRTKESNLELNFYSSPATLQADSVVIATPLAHVPDLLWPHDRESPWHHACPQSTESIVTLYAYWAPGASAQAASTAQNAFGPRPLRLPIMLNDTQADSPGQWIFDHGPTPAQGRLMAIVVSAADPSLSNEDFKSQCVRQIAMQIGLPAPDVVKCIRERHATFRATAPCARPSNSAFNAWHPNLLLAGDYTIPDYPATLESAVRSGQAAANLLLDKLARTR